MPSSLESAQPRLRSRGGIRTQLLALLLPGIALLLAYDSWNDYHALASTLETAYDQALLEPLSALNNSVRFNSSGDVDLVIPFSVQAMFESVSPHHKYLHVGLVPLDKAIASPALERSLMGSPDLPGPPSGAVPAPPPASFNSGSRATLVIYNGDYQGSPVRVAMLERELTDAAEQRYRVRVQAAESTSLRDDVRQAALRRELWQDLRMLALLALLVWLGIAWALRPLERLRASLLARPSHNLQPLEPAGVPYEVAPLVDAVNQHIADHRQLLAEQGQFLADASHQLRTPLAIMMTQAGYALRERDPAVLRETLRAIIAQLARSRRLSDQLLAMAHAGRTGDDSLPHSPPLSDLNAVARDVVLQYLPLAREKNQDLGWADVRGEDIQESTDSTPAAPVRAEGAELHEALANLLHNAISHTPVGGSITVAVRIEGDLAVAEVCDDGPGIAPESREAVFERFRRNAAPGGAHASGAGLGLAIARAYARRNGGDISLTEGRENPSGARGLCALFQLPLAHLG
jgi:two-component system sensor histidine kinase TctE